MTISQLRTPFRDDLSELRNRHHDLSVWGFVFGERREPAISDHGPGPWGLGSYLVRSAVRVAQRGSH